MKFAIFAIKVFLILIFSQYLNAKKFDLYDDDLYRNTPELIESRNFISQTHRVTTNDGYILTIFRIINPFLRQNLKSRHNFRPILLQHGFTGNSDMYLVTNDGFISKDGFYTENNNTLFNDCENFKTVGKTIGFVLSACGYDVWIANSRGNSYSKNHTTLNPENNKFWEFTIDELSLVDLPAVIRYILLTTDKAKLGYIGHSMGTTMMFALMSTNPDYSQIIEPFIALGPVAYVSKIKNTFTKFKFMAPILRVFPMPLIRFAFLKKLVVKLFGGHEIPESRSNLLAMVTHLIDESSTLVMSHFFQMMENNNFAKYDYGLFWNLKQYGHWKSPDYPLSNITSTQIALFQAENDSLADIEDIKRLKSQLKVKLLLDYWIPDKTWTHSDITLNEKCGEYIVSKILELLSQYKTNSNTLK